MADKTRPSSGILPKTKTHLTQDSITESNKLKWALESKNHTHMYDETQSYTKFSNVVGESAEKKLATILDIYFKSKTMESIDKLLKDSIMNLIKNIEYKTDPIKNKDFMCKMDAFFDYIKEHEE